MPKVLLSHWLPQMRDSDWKTLSSYYERTLPQRYPITNNQDAKSMRQFFRDCQIKRTNHSPIDCSFLTADIEMYCFCLLFCLQHIFYCRLIIGSHFKRKTISHSHDVYSKYYKASGCNRLSLNRCNFGASGFKTIVFLCWKSWFSQNFLFSGTVSMKMTNYFRF